MKYLIAFLLALFVTSEVSAQCRLAGRRFANRGVNVDVVGRRGGVNVDVFGRNRFDRDFRFRSGFDRRSIARNVVFDRGFNRSVGFDSLFVNGFSGFDRSLFSRDIVIEREPIVFDPPPIVIEQSPLVIREEVFGSIPFLVY